MISFSIYKTLCRTLWLRQGLFSFAVVTEGFVSAEYTWLEPRVFPWRVPSSSYLANARALSAREGIWFDSDYTQ